MAAIESNSNQEIRANRGEHNGDVVDLTSDANEDEVQEMEIETEHEQQTVNLNPAENEDIQPVNDDNTAPDDREMQSSMQNVTPAAGRTVHVLQGSSTVNNISPDEFQCKASKLSKIKPSKIAKSPLKSPEKDDDVSLAI